MDGRGAWRRFRRGPRWVRLLVGLAVALVAAAALQAVLWRVHHRAGQTLGAAVGDRLVVSAITFVALFVVIGFLNQRMGGAEAAGLASKAIRRNALPRTADPAVVRTGLEGFRRIQARLAPWFTGFLAVVTVALVVLAALVPRVSAAAWVTAAAMAAVTVGYALLVRNRLRRADRLLSELDGHR